MKKHTNTPWCAGEIRAGKIDIRSGLYVVGQVNVDLHAPGADADFIVTACNQFEALKECEAALRDLLSTPLFANDGVVLRDLSALAFGAGMGRAALAKLGAA